MNKTSKIIDRMVAPTVDIEALLRAGGALSNCAYNLSQLERVPERDREVLAACCKDWNEVCNGLSMLRAALKSAHPQAEQQGAGDALARAVRVLLEQPQLQGEQAFSAQHAIDRVRAALAARQPVGEPAIARIPTDHPTSIVEWLGPMPAPGSLLYTAPPAPAAVPSPSDWLRGILAVVSGLSDERIRRIEEVAWRGAPNRPAAPQGVDWQRIANEWADCACNGMQWIKNVRDFPAMAADALAEMQSNYDRIRAMQHQQQESSDG